MEQRKSWSPGKAWIELRHVHDLKQGDASPWPCRRQVFELSRGRRVVVHRLVHLLALGRDVQRFLHLARETGRRLDLLRPASWSETAQEVRACQLG